MKKKIYNNLKSIIIILVVFACFGGSVYYFVNLEMNKLDEIKVMPENLKLKAEKNKIISIQEVEDIRCVDQAELEGCENFGEIVAYSYISDAEVPPAEYEGLDEDMLKRTNNAQFFKKGEAEDGDIWVARFYQGEPFYKDGDKWLQVESATTTKQAFSRQTRIGLLEKLKSAFIKKTIAQTTSSFYAGAGNGYVRSSNANWNTAHDAASGTFTYLNWSWIIVSSQEGTSYIIERAFLPFNTSALEDGATITGASLFVYSWAVTNGDNDGYDWINVVQASQASPTTLANADFDTCGTVTNPTEGSTRKDLTTDLTIGQYHSFSLNSTALSWISTTGYTQLGLREGHDALNSAVTNETTSIFQIYSQNWAGTANDPYLTVSYVMPSAYKLKGTIKMKGTEKF